MGQTELSFFSEPQPLGTPSGKKSVIKKKKEEVFSSPLPTSIAPNVLTVTELTRRITALLEGEVGEVWLEGEISNYRRQASGHHYFTLKDAHSQISCVLFARVASSSSVQLADGLAVQIQGAITVYQPRGQYQLIARLIQPRGIGVLQAQFEKRKQQLAAEGLFNAARKRPLPRLPQCIGVVTSPTGAAIADFLHVLHRRHPGIKVIIYPVRVQGRGAAVEIANAIKEFSASPSTIGAVDVIVVARGGGSLEDLWEFNEECVARAIVESTIPVMSAIGHEIDYTIADFAADVRAPTPSAAAELIAADGYALLESANILVKRLRREVFVQQAQLVQQWGKVKNSSLFREPERRCWELQQQADHLSRVLEATLRYRWEKALATWNRMASELRQHDPKLTVERKQHQVTLLERQLYQQIAYQQYRIQAQYERLRAALAALSPEATLARGFTITRNQQGKIIASSKAVGSGEQLFIQFKDGIIKSSACRQMTEE